MKGNGCWRGQGAPAASPGTGARRAPKPSRPYDRRKQEQRTLPPTEPALQSDAPEIEEAHFGRRLPGWARLASFVPPVAFYGLWAIAVALPFGGERYATGGDNVPATVLGAYAATLGASAMTTLSVYILYIASWAPRTGFGHPLAGLALLALCGAGLAASVGVGFGLPLLAVVLHVALSRRGTRLLTFAEYGTTGLSIAWFHSMFENVGVLPWGIPVALAQGVMLLLFEMDRKRELQAQAEEARG